MTPSPRFRCDHAASRRGDVSVGVDDPFGLQFVLQGGGNPDAFQRVRDLTEHVSDICQTRGEELMDAVLHGTPVAHVVDQDFGPQQADSLDPALALLQPGRISGKVQIDQGSQALEVDPLRRGVRADDQS